MSGRGRFAALPTAEYRRASTVDTCGLVVRPVSESGRPLGVWDFTDCPGPEDFRRELVAAFARQGRGWNSVATHRSGARTLRQFLKAAAAAEPPITATAEISTAWWKQWAGDVHTRRVLAAVIRHAPGLPEVTRAFLQIPRRRPPARRGARRKQAHTRSELKVIRDAAAATVCAAASRIAANAAVMERWRDEQIPQSDPQWAVGHLLDVLARTGDLPRYEQSKDRSLTKHVERTLGGEGTAAALTRLFPTLHEAGAAAVLLIVHEAWNLSVVKALDAPSWWPNADGGSDTPAVHRVEIDKPRRGRRRHSSNNLVDVGKGSSGRAMRQILELTRRARATLAVLGRPSTKLLLAHRGLGGPNALGDFADGASLEGAIRQWQRGMRAEGVPLPARVTAQALRHSAQAHHGRARHNTEPTHDSDYLLVDEQIRDVSRGGVERGLELAVRSAREQVAMCLVVQATGDSEHDAEQVAATAGVGIELARQIVAGQLRTPVGSCADFTHSDFSPAGTPCAVSFLLCFACRNAVATGRDLPRIAYLHQVLESLRSAVTSAVWTNDWAAHHARIGDFLATYTTAESTPQLAAAISENDRALIHHMLDRRLDS